MSVCLISKSCIDLFSLSFCLSLCFLAINSLGQQLYLLGVYTASNHKLELIRSIIKELINNQTRLVFVTFSPSRVKSWLSSPAQGSCDLSRLPTCVYDTSRNYHVT